jgi:phosphoadenosine phosphosulfate reductase
MSFFDSMLILLLYKHTMFPNLVNLKLNMLTQADIFEFSKENVHELNASLLDKSPAQRIEYCYGLFGDKMVLSTSFGIQSAVMLHLATQVNPEIPVIFIDTGYLFPETYRFARDLEERLNLNLKVYSPRMTSARQEALYGQLWTQGLDGLKQYGLINKVEPMNRALQESGAFAWISGLRRNQSSTREHLNVIQLQNRTFKIHPIIEWSNRDIHAYLEQNDLPYHPLWEKAYATVGDWHSSQPISAEVDEESSRFGGLKRECGLHELSGQGDYQI